MTQDGKTTISYGGGISVYPPRPQPRVLAIDPGTTHSAYTLIDPHNYAPIQFGKIPNPDLLIMLTQPVNPLLTPHTRLFIEMIASYGMAVGADVFTTCTWIGRYQQRALDHAYPVELVFRKNVKLHHCHSNRAKDANITQALIDRFAPGQPNRGKGTKASPGWFYGFAADVWQAYALAVYAADEWPRVGGQ